MTDLITRFRRHLRDRPDSQFQELLKNSSWVLAANSLAAATAFLKSILIARCLGVEQYGTFVVLVAFVDTIREFFNLNLFTPIVKFGAEYVAEKRKDKLVALIKAMCLVSLLLCGLALVVTVVLALIFQTRLGLTRASFVFILLYGIASNLTIFHGMGIATLRLFYRFRTNSIIQICVDLLEFGCFAFALIAFPGRLDLFFVAVIIARTAGSLLIIAATIRELSMELRPYLSARLALLREDRKRITGFALGNSGSRTLLTLINSSDVLVVGLLAGKHQAGLYNLAKKLAHTLLRLTDPLRHSIFPQLAQLTSEQRYAEIRALISRVTYSLAIPCFAFLAIGFVLKDWLIVTLYGPDYHAAAWPFFVQQTIAVLGAMSFWSLPLIQSLGLMGWRFLLLVVAVFIGAAVVWPAVSLFGAVGGSLASLAAKSVVILGTIAVIIYTLNRETTRMDTRPADAHRRPEPSNQDARASH